MGRFETHFTVSSLDGQVGLLYRLLRAWHYHMASCTPQHPLTVSPLRHQVRAWRNHIASCAPQRPLTVSPLRSQLRAWR